MYACFTFYFKVLKYFLWKVSRYSHQFFCFLLFYISFYIPDITFYNFLEIHVALSEKRFLSQISLFLTDSPKALNSQNALSVTIFFLSIFPNAFLTYYWLILLLPRKHQKTKKSYWFSQILLILEAKFWWQSGKTNSFKPIILKSQFLKWHVVNCKVHIRVGKIKNSI